MDSLLIDRNPNGLLLSPVIPSNAAFPVHDDSFSIKFSGSWNQLECN